MADFIDFDEGWDDILANGLPATLYFELVDGDVSTMAATDTLASGTQTASTATKSVATPTPAGRVVIVDLSGNPWTETVGSPKAVRMLTSARGGGGKAIAAWNLNAGGAINLAASSPLTVESLAFKAAYQGEP